MKEISSINRLLLLVLALVLLILLGFLTLRKPEITYSEKIEASLSQMRLANVWVGPAEVQAAVASADEQMILIDLRPSHIFAQGNIPSSVNIPIHSLLEKNTLEMFRGLAKDGIKIVLYGNDHSETISPWTILYQIGIKDVFIMAGGYQAYLSDNPEFNVLNDSELYKEISRYDYAAILKTLGEGATTLAIPSSDKPGLKTEGETVIPIKRKKQSTLEGGC